MGPDNMPKSDMPGPGADATPTFITLGDGGKGAKGSTTAWYNPGGWSLKTKLIVAAVTVACIVGIIVGAVEGTKEDKYPDYSKLNYRLVDTYSGEGFFDMFNFFDGDDPTKGFVKYVNESTAADLNLTKATTDSAMIRVDAKTENATDGRNSVRIESLATYDTGLFIFDVIHSPYGCGTWPALWLTDPANWPDNGEVDVMEVTNNATDGNAVTLHTTAGCNMDVKRKQLGTPTYSTCDNSTNANAGCGVQGSALTYGEDFNQAGGGVYALELRDAGIRAWFFPRASIPDDITNGNVPDPSTWGTALADFPSTSCDISSHFKKQSIVANIDLCGTWGGSHSTYTEQWSCPGNCTEYVAMNPDKFEDAYWEFGSFRVFQAL